MGRRKGSKNRTPEEREQIRLENESKEKRGRGRPKGSPNKPKDPVKSGMKKLEKNLVKTKETKRLYTMTESALRQRQFACKNRTQQPDTQDDIAFNNRLIGHIMQINEISVHADKHDLLSLKSCFAAYLQLCQQNGFNVSNLAAYASMGFDYQSFAEFSKRDDPEIREFCRFVRKTCAMFRESLVSANKLNPVIGIFWQRNFDGLRNDTEQVQSIQAQEDESVDRNGEYKEKYKKLIGG